MLHTLCFFSSKCRLFHNATFFSFLYYSHFTYRVCQNLNVKLQCQKVKMCINVFGTLCIIIKYQFNYMVRTQLYIFTQDSILGIQLHVSALYIGHRYVILCLKQLYNMCVGYSGGNEISFPPEYPTHIWYSCFQKYKLVRTQLQGEHKNTPWFQAVIKSELTGIFLQNWWLQLHKLIQFHVVSHTMCPPLVNRHNIDAII